MPPPNPAEKLYHAPLSDLAVLLLKQFARLLTDRDIPLKIPEMTAIGMAIEADNTLPEKSLQLITVLETLIHESEKELQTRFEMTFAASLATDMDAIDNWESTGEFIELANYKSNAELRISAAATLLTLFGVYTHTHHLLTVIAADNGIDDVDAVLAKRALTHASGIDIRTQDELVLIHGWLDRQHRA
ncbi:MAG: hypothetical protein ACPG7F_01360 [Aggregatilineales bacterium]